MAAKTVLHMIETGGPGGAEQMMVHLAAGLGSEYHSEAALIRDSWLGTALKQRGIPVTMLRCRHKDVVTTLCDLVRLIRKRQVTLLHTHEFFMNTVGLAASWLTGIPLVATVHGINYYSKRLRRRLAYRLVGRFAGQTIAVSEAVRDFLKERVGIPGDHIRVIPNGVTVDKLPSQEKILSLRKTLKLDANAKVVGTVGSLYPVKGHTYIIDGALHVVRRYSNVVFLIVGRGGLREQLETQARSLGISPHIRFLGHREDVGDILGVCDLFVLPSLSEGMPLALLEAMAAGVPSVATRVGGVREVVEDGKSGLLVPPGDSLALAEGVTRLLEDQAFAKRIGKCAREIAVSRFSTTRMVKAYEEVYTRLLQKPARGWVHR